MDNVFCNIFLCFNIVLGTNSATSWNTNIKHVPTTTQLESLVQEQWGKVLYIICGKTGTWTNSVYYNLG